MYIGETVGVIASFNLPYKIRPIKFRWSGRLLEIKEITYTWKTKDGRRDVYHFSVTDGISLYELIFDTDSLIWKLENLEA